MGKFIVDQILSIDIKDAKTGETLINQSFNSQCPLFNFCNCKTAMCRAVLPDESCYWYRYFKKLIFERELMEIKNK